MSGQVLVILQRFGFCTEIGICPIEIGSYCVETVLYCTEMDSHLGELEQFCSHKDR